MNKSNYSNIKTAIGVSPNNFDLAIVSSDNKATLGRLNQKVLADYGYEAFQYSELDVSKGYYLLKNENLKPILFIVTVSHNFTGINLKKNLTNGIKENLKLLEGKKIWIPLMGTGDGGMEFVDSYDTTIGVLKQFKDISFTIAIPDNLKGNEFVERFRTDNLQNIEKISAEIKGSSKVKGNLTSKSKTKQPEYDNLSEYNIHRLIRDVLNIEYNLNLLPEVNAIRNNFTQKLDLTDDEKKTYAEILDKSKFVGEKPVTGFTTGDGTSENEIMFNIFSQVENQIKFLQSAGSKVQKYFAIFSGKFSQDNINYALKWFNNKQGFPVIVLTLKDIIVLADKHGVNHDEYLKQTSPDKKEQNTTSSLDLGNDELGLDEEKVEENAQNSSAPDKIPFHLDQVVDEDKLGREPLAKAFVNLIKKDIFTDKLNHSFMVHLQGEWGAGKSSFLNLIKKHLDSEEDNWVIVDFNAWQNQHINPPWWTFIDQLYRQAKKRFIPFFNRPNLVVLEKARRIIWYSGWPKIIAFLFSVILGVLFYWNFDVFSEVASDLLTTNEDLSLANFTKILIGIGTIGGSIYSFSKFITTPLFINNSGDAKSFVLRATDPMNRIKKHFNDLIGDINEYGYQVAVFIDDIDRCNKEYIVCLLEGIQTLFKEKRVLYIVAGDKNWITTSFANTYEDFASKDTNKRQLGEFFTEKAFQLSLRMPNISEEAKRNYWDYILGVESIKDQPKLESINDLTEDEQKEIKLVLSQSKSELTDPFFMKKIQDDFNLTGDTVSNIVIEEKNKDTEELKHLLQDYHEYIDTNPRSIIRLANTYTMSRSTLMAERALFDEHKLFRWLVIENLSPSLDAIISSNQDINFVEKAINDMKDVGKRNKCKTLLKGTENIGGSISMEEIKTIKGL